jgi:hypothetical protein
MGLFWCWGTAGVPVPTSFTAAATMQLDLTDEETRALLNLLVETIEADSFRCRRGCRYFVPSWRGLDRWARRHRRRRGRQPRKSAIRDGRLVLGRGARGDYRYGGRVIQK